MFKIMNKAMVRAGRGVRPTRMRRAGLEVVILEERATPAVAESMMQPPYPPESFLLAPFAPPAPTNLANPAAATAAPSTGEVDVRADLFGGGDDKQSDSAEFWDEWFAAAKEAAPPADLIEQAPPADDTATPAKSHPNPDEPRVVFVAEPAGEGAGE